MPKVSNIADNFDGILGDEVPRTIKGTTGDFSDDVNLNSNYLIECQNIPDLLSKGEGYYFDGIDDKITISDNNIIDLGTSAFAISALINTEEILVAVIGDILNKYDSTNKKGFNFNINSNKQLFFGLDNNKSDIIWTEVAPQLGSETNINSLAVYNGKLYGGTYLNGMLYQWNDTNAWVEVAPQLGSETNILSLAVYNGKLYGGTSPNGKLYQWNDTNAWVEVAPQLGSETNILSLAVYNGKLYGGTNPNGKLYEWNNINAWVEVAPKLGSETQIMSLAVYNGKIYGGTHPNGKLYEWNNINAWVEVAPQLGSETRIYSLAVYNGKLYGGTYPNGKLHQWNNVNTWVEVAPQLGSETYIRSLAVYNGKLYGGTGPNGKLHQWNNVNAWTEVAPQLSSEIQIFSLAVYNGKLYGGTYADGKLFEWNTGISTTYDYQFEPGNKHLFLVKDNESRTLKIYVNGLLIKESSQFTIADYDISNTEDLLIGFGSIDYFNGLISNIKHYNYAPSETEVKELSSGNPIHYKLINASQVSLTSGALTIGKKYIIDTFVAGDDFSNVGGDNTSGDEFTAIATTPTTWTNSSSLRQIGCIAQYEQPQIGHNQWLDNSGNELHGEVSGTIPINLPQNHNEIYKYKTAITNDITFTDIIPIGYMLDSIVFVNSTANATVLDLGTSASGQDVFNQETIGASGITTIAINKTFSMTAKTSLYLNDDGAGTWNSASLTALFIMKKSLL